MKVLITGFEPFGGYTENVSWVVTKEVAAQGVSGVEIATALMPVSFERVAEELRDALKKHRPNLIIMLGQSGGSEHIKLERIAINMMDSKLSDNDNYTPNEEPIYPEAPAALFTNLSIKSLCKAIEGQDIAV